MDDCNVSMDIDDILKEYPAPEMNIDTPDSDEELKGEELQKFLKEASVSFFKEFGLLSHQLKSFDDFVKHGLHRVFESVGEHSVEPEYNPTKKGGGYRLVTISFDKPTIEKPTYTDENGNVKALTPKQARIQRITYSSRIKVEVTVKIFELEDYKGEKLKGGKGHGMSLEHSYSSEVLFGRVPVMVNSSLCHLHGQKADCDFEQGGYFVIKGSEKAFIAQEERCFKRFWVATKPDWTLSYTPDANRRKNVFIKIIEKEQKKVTEQKKKIIEKESLGELCREKVLSVYFYYATYNIWILFFALGASSDKEIVEMIGLNIDKNGLSNILLSTIHEADEKCPNFRHKGIAIRHISEMMKSSKYPPEEAVDKCIDDYLFPFLDSRRKKAVLLGYLVRRLLKSYFGKLKEDNKDDFRNKRLELASELLERELKIHVMNAVRRMGNAIQKDLPRDGFKCVDHYVDASIVTKGLARAFTTGGWSSYKKTERKMGVVETLGRTNPLETLSDMRKTQLLVNYTGVMGDARYPNPSHFGKICFLSTKDGEKCGLVKNLAVTGLVSTSSVDPSLVEKLFTCGMHEVAETITQKGVFRVFLNGDWVGVCEDAVTFVHKLKTLRRCLEIDPQVEIKKDEKEEVRIFSDPGRILRPLLILENNNMCVSAKKLKRFRCSEAPFHFLLKEKLVELIGVEEEEDCQVAWGIEKLRPNFDEQSVPNYTHCELDTSFLLGLSCGIIPFANHNNARRVLFQAEKHSHQAIGFYTTNQNVRMDTNSHQLYYPQKPLFRTMIADCLDSLGRQEYFNGHNAIVAVNVHLGFNQEDSIVMNETSLERGMFRSEHVRCYRSEVDEHATRYRSEVESGKVEVTKVSKGKDRVDFLKPQTGAYGNIECLEEDGFPYVGADLQSGDIVIGKVAESGADHSVKLKHTEKGRVQKVVLSANDEGKNTAFVSLRQVRTPQLGDKFSSMHGQKGVIGHLESQENLPFTVEGIVPDIVINPHAFPTRQTPGQLLESALGKGIAKGGSVKYATPFTTAPLDAITDQLHKSGYSRWGAERLYNGTTGERLKSLIFIGPTFYQRLIHMSEDKVKFRSTGPVHPLTRQPVADRKRYGGVKFGEMERDCLLAHGASANLQERLFFLSDHSQMFICENCSHFANVILRENPKVRGPYCRFCNSSEHVVKINVPYGAKLLYQELFSMGVCLKFKTEQC